MDDAPPARPLDADAADDIFPSEANMWRMVGVVCAISLAGPAIAQELRLGPPTLSARQDRCSPRQRADCQGVYGQRTLQTSLSCNSCDAGSPTMPAEIVSPPPGDTPQRPRVQPGRGPDCQPRTASLDDACAMLPRLDALPRP